MEKHSGQPVKRREDKRLLFGRGRYVDDITVPNAAHAAFYRSPHAHARILSIDPAAALEVPGVLAVLTAEDWAAEGCGDLGLIWAVDNRDGSPMNERQRPPLARDKMRHVGDTVAVVVAETRYAAEDGLEALEIEVEPLGAVTDPRAAFEPGAPLVHEQFASNQAVDWETGDQAAVAEAFATAAHVTTLELVNNRIAGSPMEPRACIGIYDPGTEHYTLYTSSQAPHLIRQHLADDSLKVPEQKLRVVSPSVGGGFGVKIYHYPEEALVLWASRRLGRPVRWTATRAEALMVDTHARDHRIACRLALDAEGKMLALEVDSFATAGAYLSDFGICIPTQYFAVMLSGFYRIPAIYCRVRLAYTNTTPVDAYRGAGRPEAIHLLERLVDNAAHELGMDPVALRERNLIPLEAFPYDTGTGALYDSGNLPGLIEKLRTFGKYDALRAEQEECRARGELMGVGVGCFFDIGGFGPSKMSVEMGGRMGFWESAMIRVHPGGKITLFAGTHSHGQGHPTTYAQIAADRLGIPMEDIDVVEGDTDRVPFGLGTYASRSLTIAGPAIQDACDKIVVKGRNLAAAMLGVEVEAVEFVDGVFRAESTNRTIPFAELARAAYAAAELPDGMEPGLEATTFYDPPDFNYPSGVHLCTVFVDRETGRLRLRDYLSIDDIGTVINPMIVKGQVHGGIAQGLGQALMEHVVYDPDSGQLLTGSFMDYCMPRADDMPFIDHVFQETPSTTNPMGAKAIGECGTIGAPATIANAVVDALRPLGVTHVDMPLTSQAIWRAIQAASGRG